MWPRFSAITEEIVLNFSTFCDILLKKSGFIRFFSEKWGKMLKNQIFVRISYEIFKIPQKQFKIFEENFCMFSIFFGVAVPPARQA